MRHEKRLIHYHGDEVPADAPVVLSASRRTDIPAFSAEQFFGSFERGYFEVPNPRNSRISLVSTVRTRAVVFWTRNPEPLISRLTRLGRTGHYSLITVTDYVQEGWEPGMPDVSIRIDRFRRLSESCGPARCIWRFDPIVLSEKLTALMMTERIARIARSLRGATTDLVFSFVDIDDYRKVKTALKETGARPPSPAEREFLAEAIGEICCRNGMTATTCAEKEDFERYGISHGSCIRERWLRRACPDDGQLSDYLDSNRGRLKDPSQRQDCGCILSRDIGSYATCPSGCIYCYAG